MFGLCCSVPGGRFSAVPSHQEDDEHSFRRCVLHRNRHGRRRRGLRGLAALLLGVSSLSALAAVHRWNQSFVLREVDAPLDHWASSVQKPWYALTCPKFSSLGRDSDPDPTLLDPIPIWMISARPFSQVASVLSSWTEQGFNVELVNTTEWSTNHAKAEAVESCQRPSFGARLFSVYRRALSERFLSNASTTARYTHAVLLEDDARLVDGTALRRELGWAVSHNVDYYSFFAVGSDDNDATTAPIRSCVYDHGTVAQVLSRRFAERLVHHVDRKSLCRLPIDLWIAKHGPWYVTRQKLVEHVGTRLHLP